MVVARKPEIKISSVKVGLNFTDYAFKLIAKKTATNKSITLLNRFINSQKQEIKNQAIFEIESLSGAKWEDVKGQISGPIEHNKTRAQRLEASFQYNKRTMINKAIGFKRKQSDIIAKIADGNLKGLAKYGVKSTDSSLEALIKVNKKLRADAIKSIARTNEYNTNRLVSHEALGIRTQESKSWADESDTRVLKIISEPDKCPICEPYTNKFYPKQISLLPPYHPNCRCRAERKVLK